MAKDYSKQMVPYVELPKFEEYKEWFKNYAELTRDGDWRRWQQNDCKTGIQSVKYPVFLLYKKRILCKRENFACYRITTLLC